MFDNQIRLRGAQLFQRVVTGQHGAGMNAAVSRGFDVVFHVADEQRFVRLQIISGEDFMDFFTLVPNIGVRPVQKIIKAGHAALRGEMVGANGAQKERANFFCAAKSKEAACMRQFTN